MHPATGETPWAIARQIQGQLRGLIHEELWKALAAKGSDHEPGAFPVDAAGDTWQNSGVKVKAGQHVLVEAAEREMWDLGWGPTDAKGYSRGGSANDGLPVFHTGRPIDGWHWGALICAVGDGRSGLDDQEHEVEIRTKRGFTVDTAGYLYFLANDNRQRLDGTNGFDDNSGIIHVTVTVTDPEKELKVAPAALPNGSATPASSPQASPAKPTISPVTGPGVAVPAKN
jgi:hypothetical protein